MCRLTAIGLVGQLNVKNHYCIHDVVSSLVNCLAGTRPTLSRQLQLRCKLRWKLRTQDEPCTITACPAHL